MPGLPGDVTLLHLNGTASLHTYIVCASSQQHCIRFGADFILIQTSMLHELLYMKSPTTLMTLKVLMLRQ